MKILKLDSKIYQYIKNSCIAVLLTGTAILLFACENDIAKIKAFSSPEDLPVLEARNFETLYTDSGQVRFLLKTVELLRYENDGKTYVEFPQGMELIKYDNDKNIISSLTADYAKQFVKEQKWEAKNNVVVTNQNGDTLKTDHLIWEEKTEKIYTEEFVEIIRPDQSITGIGFTSDQSMQNWKIKNPSGTIYLDVGNKKRTDLEGLPSDPENDRNQSVKGKLQFEK